MPNQKSPYGVQRPLRGPGASQEPERRFEPDEPENNVERILFSKPFQIAVVLVLLLLGVWFFYTPALPAVGPYRDPKQTTLKTAIMLPAPPGYEIRGSHTYDIKALILSRKTYSDQQTPVSPVDFALGWGQTTTKENVNNISWWQDRRWYRFKYSTGATTLTIGDIQTHSANTHIIPDFRKPELRTFLMRLKRGQSVHLKGYLVSVKRLKDNRHILSSSTSRTDNLGGACEVLYVTDAQRID